MDDVLRRRRATAVRLGGVSAAAFIVLAVGGLLVASCGGAPPDHEVVIPVGTAALAARGQDVEFFPEGFTMRVGQTLRIVNDDVATATLGPFVIGAGETLTTTFREPGVVEGWCSYTESNRVFLEVLP